MTRKILGGAGTSIYGGQLADVDQNPEVRGDRWYGSPNKIGIASKMVRDAHVRRSLDSLIAPIISATWDFQPASLNDIDIEIAAFCRHIFIERLSWTHVLRAVCRYMRDGFSLFEVTDDICTVNTTRFPTHPGNGIGIGITGFHYRPSWTVHFWHQSAKDPTRLTAIDQWLPGSDQEESGLRRIPADRLLRFTWDQEGANFAGLAPLRSAYGAWKTKLLLMVVEAIRHEREHTGIPTISMPEGATEDMKQEARVILSELRANEKGYLLLPNGYEFKFSTTNATTNIGETIERCNFDIAHNLGVGFMLLGKAGTAGSYALAQTQSGQYEISLDNHVKFIEDGFNYGFDGWSPVERIVRLNYGADVSLPRLVARNMPTRDWSKILPVVHNLTVSKHITADNRTEAFIRDVLFLPPHEPESARQVEMPATPVKTPSMTNEDLKT